ncbi:bacterial regulatory helix-turn-helix s, AraC family protein [Acinetobacter baumannii 1007214]|uniref:AraC family transcriptional regulator n=1 Tax=Acinetobacter baumannii TaxID=470 RepID=UPI00044E9FC4|nr:AraC family transcriptional regulator [Acinetobacter baumannii]EXE20907.1 bacterial regulatory helix-turn-helix s, AraC family protein [Acinetobacter baumannii 50595]EXH89614.1 bacterial regulatory helix-turn-helix s, AraC family protein [Acinetobacter baumannii 3390]EXQ82722.1 bacterial regulatory helix-turn-helix s, AraC family protein [Acinetobacter baumannii 1007214]KCY36423.1 bacterial regulatory helix-turn-helix s, AraC family protein [Acinetobacter baumannii 1262761-105]
MTLVQIPKLTTTLEDFLKNLESIEPLFDALSSVVFFIKNTEARYVFVNQTLVNRCGLKDKTAILGKTSSEVFPHSLGKIYTSQDLQVIRRGKKLTEQLELHLYAKNQSGWCLTHKEPLFDADGNLVGIAGISNDLNVPENTHPAFYKMVQVEEYIKKNYAETITLAHLTAIAGVSVAQLERYCKKIYHLTPRQMISKIRLQVATELLASDLPITQIGLRCGYTDHSAFCRQFKLHTGMSPTLYRASIKNI